MPAQEYRPPYISPEGKMEFIRLRRFREWLLDWHLEIPGSEHAEMRAILKAAIKDVDKEILKIT